MIPTHVDAHDKAEWDTTTTKEYNSSLKNNTWELVPFLKRKILVKVYKTKFTSNGVIERHKAKLIAKGFYQ
jgi:hypothetical protein